MQLLYEGKAKKVFQGEQEDTVIMQFKNSLTAFDGTKKADLEGKGKINAIITSMLIPWLGKQGVPTHFIKTLSETELLCYKVKILPIEVVGRNIAAGSFCKRYGINEGIVFEDPLIEFFLKDDALHDPLINNDAIIRLNLATPFELELMSYYAKLINFYLRSLFSTIGLTFVDFKLEFGRMSDGTVVLADEITPDTMRLWRNDVENPEEKILDKDRFRRDIGDLSNVKAGYSEILDRLTKIGLDKFTPAQPVVKASIFIDLKPAIADASGEVINRALNRLKFSSKQARVGKIVRISSQGYIPIKDIQNISKEVLSNPLIEDYQIKFDLGEG